jgi:hypothetical protein
MDGTTLKYNTVSGRTAGSKVWIVYENGRAYPSYLVRYYRGDYDASRTPYQTRAEANDAAAHQLNNDFTEALPDHSVGRCDGQCVLDFSSEDLATSSTTASSTTTTQGHAISNLGSSLSSSISTNVAPQAVVPAVETVFWSYQDNSGWSLYSDRHQRELEAAWKAQADTLTITTDSWSYLVDFKSMKQKNVSHPAHTERHIRRSVPKTN